LRPHGAGRGIQSGTAAIPPELALAELRLGAVEIENKKRGVVLPSLPDYPVVLGTIHGSDMQTRKFYGTLQEDSDLVWPDIFPQGLPSPFAESPSLTQRATSAPQVPTPAVASSTTAAAKTEEGAPEVAAAEAAEAVASVVSSAIASIAKQDEAVAHEASEEATPRETGLEKQFPSLDLKGISREFGKYDPQQSVDLDSLAYSATAGSSHRSAPDASPPAREQPFSRVIDLGAALRIVASAEPNSDGTGTEAIADGTAISETTVMPHASEASPDTTTKAAPGSIEGTVDANCTERTERTASPTAGDFPVNLSPPATALQADTVDSPSPQLPSRSPRPPLPASAYTQVDEARQRQDEAEHNAGVRATQDILRSVLIPETQVQSSATGQ